MLFTFAVNPMRVLLWDDTESRLDIYAAGVQKEETVKISFHDYNLTLDDSMILSGEDENYEVFTLDKNPLYGMSEGSLEGVIAMIKGFAGNKGQEKGLRGVISKIKGAFV